MSVLFQFGNASFYLHSVGILVLSVPDNGNHGSVTIILFVCPEVRTVLM